MTIKGAIFTDEHKHKISIAHLGMKKPWSKGKQNIGKKHTEEWKKLNGLRMVAENRKRMIEGRHNLWKGGISSKNDRIKHSIEYRLWRESVFSRDRWTCQNCRLASNKLNAHHLKNFSSFPELRFSIDNGITICSSCHKKFHKIYGIKNNNQQQIEEFIKNEAVIK